jgi:hypothetical protein
MNDLHNNVKAKVVVPAVAVGGGESLQPGHLYSEPPHTFLPRH